MNIADTHTAEIKEYNGWLIIKLINSPKLKTVGLGTLLNNLNKNDLHISKDALHVLRHKFMKDLDKTDPALEILSDNAIWWASINNGIIIPPEELIHIYKIPLHTECDNIIDDEIKIIINKQK